MIITSGPEMPMSRKEYMRTTTSIGRAFSKITIPQLVGVGIVAVVGSGLWQCYNARSKAISSSSSPTYSFSSIDSIVTQSNSDNIKIIREDLNNDGNLDLILYEPANGKNPDKVFRYRNDGNGNFSKY